MKCSIGCFRKDKTKKWILLLWALAILVNIKSIFTDYGVDNAYALATSYRHILGDGLFREMWEPHQTSSFLIDILLIPYRIFVSSRLEGAALYLQICGTILYGIVTFVLFRNLLKIAEKELAHLICIFFFAVRAKQTVFPEFSNMHIVFSALMIVFLCNYMYSRKEGFYLIMAAVSFCLECLAYPSCIITIVPVLFWLYYVSGRHTTSIFAFAAICILTGGAYIGYFGVKTGSLHDFIGQLSNIFFADKTHGITWGGGTPISMALSME